jgi:hypothetical protein
MKTFVAAFLGLLLASTPALAQQPAAGQRVNLRQAIKTAPIPAADVRPAFPLPSTASARKPQGAARGLLVAGAAVGGFFGGGFLGHAIERKFWDCNCDDPGVRGFLIGAPAGAIAAGIVTFKLTK